jgi:hypothetical protein
MPFEFRWIDWNVGKVEGHGLTGEEVEVVVTAAGASSLHRPVRLGGPQRAASMVE